MRLKLYCCESVDTARERERRRDLWLSILVFILCVIAFGGVLAGLVWLVWRDFA